MVLLDITLTFKRHYLIIFLAITIKITNNVFSLTEGKKCDVKILHSFLLMFVKSCDVGLLDETLHKTSHRHLSPWCNPPLLDLATQNCIPFHSAAWSILQSGKHQHLGIWSKSSKNNNVLICFFRRSRCWTWTTSSTMTKISAASMTRKSVTH
jgi:hypothetical protein